MKFCKRCGVQLESPREPREIEVLEKRMDSEMEGLFWSAIFGIGLILGGIVLMKKVGFRDAMIIAFMVLSSMAFLTYFALGVWQVRRLTRSLKATDQLANPTETRELGPAKETGAIEPVPSVTERTTNLLKIEN